jgi:hypothetical protein
VEGARGEYFFWFIRDDGEPDFEAESWADFKKKWLDLVPANGRFRPINGQVATLRDMTADDYVNSDPLDLDHLSPGAS